MGYYDDDCSMAPLDGRVLSTGCEDGGGCERVISACRYSAACLPSLPPPPPLPLPPLPSFPAPPFLPRPSLPSPPLPSFPAPPFLPRPLPSLPLFICLFVCLLDGLVGCLVRVMGRVCVTLRASPSPLKPACTSRSWVSCIIERTFQLRVSFSRPPPF